MGTTDVLRILTAVDVGPLQAGMNQAASVVQQTTDRMTANFKQMQGASGLWLPPDLVSEVSVARDKVVESVQKIGTHTNAAATEARHAMHGLAEELGVHMPRFVQTFLSHIGPVAGIMAAAFTPIAIIGMLQVLGELPDAIEKGINSLRGWDAEAKQKWEEEQARIVKLRDAMIDAAAQVDKARATAGKTGKGATEGEAEFIEQQIKNKEALKKSLEAQLQATEEYKKKLTFSWKGVAKEMLLEGGTMSTEETSKMLARPLSGKELDQAKDGIKSLKTQIDALEISLIQLGAQKKIIPITDAAEDKKQNDDLIAARIDADRRLAMAHIEAGRQMAENDYRMSEISLAQLVNATIKAENEKFKAEQDAITRKKSLAVEKEKTGTDSAPELARLNAEAKALTEAHEATLYGIKARYSEETRRMMESTGIAQIEGARRVATETTNAAIQSARQQYEAHAITAGQETALLLTAAEKQYTSDKAALQKRLELAKLEPEKKAAEIINLNAELEALEVKHQANLQSIRADGQKKEDADNKARLDARLASDQRLADMLLANQTAMDSKRLSGHQITTKQWYDSELIALNKWYVTTATLAMKELADAEKRYGKDSKEYEIALQKKLHADEAYKQKKDKLLTDEENKNAQSLDRMTAKFNQQLLSWGKGQQTMGQMWGNTWNGLVGTLESNLLKMAEQWIAQAVFQKAMAKNEIVVHAKTAAAGAYHAMVGIPYVGPVLGAIAAGATFAAVMAFGSFKKGGILNQDMFMFGHAKEMMLPEHISTGLQDMIESGQTPGGRSGNLHLNYQPTIIGGEQWMKKQMDTHSDHLARLMKRKMREGALPGYGI